MTEQNNESQQSQSNRIDFLAGETQALLAVVHALIDCIPHPEQFAERLAKYAEVANVASLNSRATDTHREGFQHALQTATSAAKLAAARRVLE
ncbi:hypothetical protein [Burkholderia seminalis]|uniref:hypothetical protein n=1 Tax=Burkholderia seminalis TaxID=488731 RepID=UPI0026560876|nr:hypothetical protein [Burkholderia seminalis]MDN7848101.1 hypothetical protein [Burkholderia seminalis]